MEVMARMEGMSVSEERYMFSASYLEVGRWVGGWVGGWRRIGWVGGWTYQRWVLGFRSRAVKGTYGVGGWMGSRKWSRASIHLPTHPPTHPPTCTRLRA